MVGPSGLEKWLFLQISHLYGLVTSGTSMSHGCPTSQGLRPREAAPAPCSLFWVLSLEGAVRASAHWAGIWMRGGETEERSSSCLTVVFSSPSRRWASPSTSTPCLVCPEWPFPRGAGTTEKVGTLTALRHPIASRVQNLPVFNF